VLAALVGLTLVVAACGSDDSSSTADAAASDAATGETTADTVAATEPADTTSDTVAEPAATEPSETTEDGSSGTDSATFPVTIEHKYGETTIEEEPRRVVSVGFAEHDTILALGVTPIAVRDWYGDQPFATWPWAQDELGDAEPEVLPSTELNFEQIAALDPDLILGIGSGMTESDYATLAAIAPTIAQPDEYADYGTPWQMQVEITGAALGRSEEAAQVIADTEQLFTDARAEHPEFEGQTAAAAFTFEDQPGAYSSEDPRSRVLTDLGFVIPPEFDERGADSFYFTVSQEELAELDTDVVVWIVSSEAEYAAISAMPLRETMTAYTEGREVIADPLLSGAFSFSSPLSLQFVVDELVPELALAVDGDPQTAVPSMAVHDVVADPDAAAALGPDEQAAADAWALVFDSAVAFAEKAPHLEDAEALQSTIDAYTTAGAAMGGISLRPTGVVLDGGTATIVYDVYFGDSPAYTAVEGETALVDGTWVVGRDEFCTFMASARNACPA
jgi:iron complex transport system substrate-binding protein